MFRTLSSLLIFAGLSWGQFSSTATALRKGSSLPATCNVGQVFFKTSATIGAYTCVTTNNWFMFWNQSNNGYVFGNTTLNPATSEPVCDVSRRGHIVRVVGGAGVADTFRQCVKNAADSYEWIALGAVGGTHTQNTDTGTTATCFQLDTDATPAGPKLCNDTGGWKLTDKDDVQILACTTAGICTFGAGTDPWNLTGLTDDVAPSAPGSANQFTAWVDRTLGIPAWILNGGSAFYPATGAQKVTFTGPTQARQYTLPDADKTLMATDTVAQTSQIPAVTVTLTTSTPVTVSTTLNAVMYFNQHTTEATAITYNLPTAAAGKQFCFSNSYGDGVDTGALTIATSAAGQYIVFTDGTLSASGGNVASGGAAADAACVVGLDATHWQLYVNRGTWTKN